MSNSYPIANRSFLAFVAFVSLCVAVVTFVPLSAGAHGGGENGKQMRGERFEKFEHARDGIRGRFGDMGKHRGWFIKNEEAREWMADVHESIKDDDYDDFKDAVDGTVLEDKTTSSIFDDLSDASNAREAGDHTEARDIMKELREDGYHFKKLIHDSLKQLFSKN